MSQVAIDEMIEGCRQSVYQRSLQIKSQVWETLSASGIDPDAIDGLVSIFDDSFDPFYGMESQYKQEKFFGHSGVHWCVCVCAYLVCVRACVFATHMYVCCTYKGMYICKYSYTCIHIFCRHACLFLYPFPCICRNQRNYHLVMLIMYLLFLATRGVWCKKRIRFSMFQYLILCKIS